LPKKLRLPKYWWCGKADFRYLVGLDNKRSILNFEIAIAPSLRAGLWIMEVFPSMIFDNFFAFQRLKISKIRAHKPKI
jgi:hypothetical protein